MVRYFLPLWLVLVLSVHLSAQAQALEPLSIELSSDHVDITTGFTGGSVVLFGTKSWSGDMVIELEGPRKDVVVRKKDNVFGAWVNRSWMTFKDIPVYYDLAYNAQGDDAYVAIGAGVNSFDFFATRNEKTKDTKRWKLYRQAYIVERQNQGFYPLERKKISFLDDNFFRVDMHLPANVPKGLYTVRALLVRGDKVVHRVEKTFKVGQVGFSAKVYSFAQKESFAYAALVIFIAVVSGWVSNKVARRS